MRVGKGHGRRLLRSARVRPALWPGRERPFIARICGRARARVGAGAVRAPDCPRAGQAQDALRLSAESGSFRTGPARAGSGSGCLFPRTHHSTVSENASPMREILLNFHEQFAVVSADRIRMSPSGGVGTPALYPSPRTARQRRSGAQPRPRRGFGGSASSSPAAASLRAVDGPRLGVPGRRNGRGVWRQAAPSAVPPA